MACAVIFGGTGFIGSFFADFLLAQGVVDKVYLVDLESPADKASAYRRLLIGGRKDIHYLPGDVRKTINLSITDTVALIANFAAVHREPGHEDFEYYETNLLGAENVCAWAEVVKCNRLIFTSSISPYGLGEIEKDERTLPVPATAYGGSKLAAEKIHQTWQARDYKERRLVIARPGVVFGPGEGGNVSRLVKAVLHRYFFYMGNRNTRKAGVYVKELCNAMWWVLQQQEKTGEHVSLFNMSMNPGPSIKDYVDVVCRVAGIKRMVPAVPYSLLLIAAYVIDVIAKPLGISHPFSPVRIRKLVRSNNIRPGYLLESGYPYLFSLESAFLDWKKSCPEEWR